MKQMIFYCCEVCGRRFDNKYDAQADEAKCYNLTLQEYLRWKDLCCAAAKAERIVASIKNLDTEDAFDSAIKELVDFERKHELSSKDTPTDFSW